MKKNKRSMLAFIGFILIAFIFIFSCRKPQVIEVNDSVVQNGKTTEIDTNCDCKPPNIFQCIGNRACAKKFPGGSFSKTFTITWTTPPGGTSTVDLCYNWHCKLEAKFHNIPTYLGDCLKEDQCYVLSFKCSSTAEAQGDDHDAQNNPIHIAIIGDPHIVVTCNGTDFTGELQ